MHKASSHLKVDVCVAHDAAKVVVKHISLTLVYIESNGEVVQWNGKM